MGRRKARSVVGSSGEYAGFGKDTVNSAKLATVLVIACSISGNSAVFASEAVANDSASCSALFHILTSLPNNEQAQSVAIMMGEVYRAHESDRLNQSVSNGDVHAARDKAEVELAELYRKWPGAVVDQYLQCNSWRAAIVTHVNESSVVAANQSVVEESIMSVPGIPDTPSVDSATRGMISEAIASAFDSWEESRPARDSFKSDLIELAGKEQG